MMCFGTKFVIYLSNKERVKPDPPMGEVMTMTTHNAVQVAKKRKRVPRVSAPMNDKGSKAITTKKQTKPKSQNKKQKTIKRGVSRNCCTPDDMVDDAKAAAVINESGMPNDASTVRE